MRTLATALAVCILAPAGPGAVHADAINTVNTVHPARAIAATSKASGPFRIALIHYAQGRTLNSEYLVVQNVGRHRHSLTGYLIVDPNDNQRYRFPKTALRPGLTVTLHTGHGRNRPHHRYWRQDDPMWNNDGDQAQLRRPGGKVVDRCSYDGTEGGTAQC
jgi:lamin tail-like protein